MTSLLVLQIEDRKEEPLQTFLNHNKTKCEIHNVEYVFVEKSSFHVPPYWQKLYELEKCMTDYPFIEYFMWLDSDAFLVDFSKSKMKKFLDQYSEYSVIISRDMPPWQEGEFNAGSFIFKNDEMGKIILKDWISKYNPDNWSYENSKWSTPSAWSGIDYEQGAFVKKILSNPIYENNIKQLPYHILNNNSCTSNLDDNISVHLANYYKEDENLVQNCIENFIKVEEGFSSKKESFNYNLLGIIFFLLLFLIVFFIMKSTKKYIRNCVLEWWRCK